MLAGLARYPEALAVLYTSPTYEGWRPTPPRSPIPEGFRVSADAVDYLLEAGDKGAPIVARDTSLRTLRVL